MKEPHRLPLKTVVYVTYVVLYETKINENTALNFYFSFLSVLLQLKLVLQNPAQQNFCG